MADFYRFFYPTGEGVCRVRGSVVQKPKGTGRWYVVMELDRDPGSGARKRRWHSGYASKRDAERGLARMLAARDEGMYVSPKRLSLAVFLDDHWLPAIESTVLPTTFHSYQSHVRLYVKPRLGAEQLQRVTPDQLSKFYRDLLRTGGRAGGSLSPNTVRRVHATLHRALRDATRWGYLQRNPAAAAVKPRQPAVGARDITTWTAAEVRTFLDAVSDDRLFAMWRLAAMTGMRRGEIVGLRWADVDLGAHRLAVRQTITGIGAKVRFGEPKTKRGKRNIALDKGTVIALSAWRRRQDLERASVGEAWMNTDLVFTRADGALIHPDAVTTKFRAHVEKAGVRIIRLHDLRHTHASLALQAGIPAKVVSDRLGHATVSFTLDVYSHVVPGLQEEAAERIAGLMG